LDKNEELINIIENGKKEICKLVENKQSNFVQSTLSKLSEEARPYLAGFMKDINQEHDRFVLFISDNTNNVLGRIGKSCRTCGYSYGVDRNNTALLNCWWAKNHGIYRHPDSTEPLAQCPKWESKLEYNLKKSEVKTREDVADETRQLAKTV